jgi:hypothetical protein
MFQASTVLDQPRAAAQAASGAVIPVRMSKLVPW